MSQTASKPESINWSVHDIQEAYCRSQARYRTIVAGRRFGKNHAAIVSEADFALDPVAYDHGRDTPSEVVLWWIGPTYNQTKKYGFQKAKQALPDEYIEETRATQPFEIHLKNGVIWEFYSYDRPKSLDGAGVDSMVIDERGYMPTEIWEDNLAAMLLDTNGRVSFIGKPWPNDHFEETFTRGQDPEQTEYDSWHATSYDNPMIPDERIDEIFGDFPEPVFRREIMAEFGMVGEYFNLDMLSFVDKGELQDTNYTYVLGVDVGVEADANRARERDTDYWAAVLLAVHPRHAEAYVIDAIRERGLTLKQGVDWVSAIAANISPIHIYVESNQSQRWLKQELADQGLNAVAVHNTEKKEDRILQISIPLERGTVKFVNQETGPNGYDPRWKNLIGELLAFPDGSHDDTIDALQIAIDNSGVVGSNLILGTDPYSEDKSERDPRRMD